METELISVIIPVYNVEPYLERCLQSVLENTYRNLQVICVNDGSTDGCGAILARYAEMDHRIVVITSENGGLSAARNKGMDAATGAFITFVDSDDWIHPKFFELMMDSYRNSECDIVICDHLVSSQMTPYHDIPDEPSHRTLLNIDQLYRTKNLKGYVTGKLYPAELVQGARFVEKRGIIEDVLFNVTVFSPRPDLKVCYLQENLYYYYTRMDSLVHNITHEGMFLTAEAYLDLLTRVDDPRHRQVILVEAMKILLSARYWLPKRKRTPERDKCDRLLQKAVAEFTALPNVSAKKKMMYKTMHLFPSVYAILKQVRIQMNRRK